MPRPRKRRPPALPLPPGIDNFADFGRLIGWGRGDADALARAASITRAEVLRMQITVEMAIIWRELYESVTRKNPRNPSSAGRTTLMARIIELLEE